MWQVSNLLVSAAVCFHCTPASSSPHQDPECLFSFSGATISKIRNQFSNATVQATVMVGQWAAEPDLDLLAVQEFEGQLQEGWK